MKKKNIKNRVAFVGIGTVILAGLGLGAAMATTSSSPDNQPTAVTQQKPVINAPDYKTNARGQTFGSISEIDGQPVEPDLIQALATNGTVGYVDDDALKAATGHPSQFKSPEEALRWQEANGNKTTVIPVYESDGVTRVGEFVIQPSEGEEIKK
ncbi:hypothetical protein [Arthrobacter sp. 18067]|uniref:hypothetical protein n=1 Tax=Arthrobacter sp. 18067 TaxID=2681413 RepID=UPI0013569245|nr:hypothetical protein [Arthrobacter sp. 18067]